MKRIAICLLLLTSPVFAQQQSSDPAFLQAALASLQAQRNSAMDSAAALEAQLKIVAGDLAKANAKIKELEIKSEQKE